MSEKITVTLDANDVSDLAETLHQRTKHTTGPLSQGWLEYLLCDIFRSWKDVDFFKEEPICGRGD